MDVHIYATSKTAQLGSHGDLKDAYNALIENTKWSKSVILISAYYGVCFADQLFQICRNARMARDVTLIFASAANSSRQTQIDDLNKLSALLIKSKHARRRVKIMIATDITFLHSKIFAFTSPVGHKRYMLGSANFSSAAFSTNDEIMILERGRHAGLESYIEYVTDHSELIEDANGLRRKI